MNTPTLEQQRKLVSQWKETGPELESRRIADLASLTDEAAAVASERLLWVETVWRARPNWSGLVEQQDLFRKLHVP
jgi:hypothetical protein